MNKIILSNIFFIIKKKKILNNINLTIKQGERIAIIGANGSGKTILSELIAGLNKPTSGSIKINYSPLEIKNKTNRVGMQFQEGHWPKNISCKNILELCVDHNIYSENEILKLIDTFKLERILNKSLPLMSGGEKQRFNSFLSILNNPSIVIIDELISGLDFDIYYRILFYFKQYFKKHKQQTFLLISHIPSEIEMLCNRIVVLDRGNVYMDLSLKQIKNKYSSVSNFFEYYFKNKINNHAA